MKNNNTIELKLGQKLYKYSTIYLMQYEVFGILDREDGKYYQIRCLSCRHGEQCEILIKIDDNKKLKYVSILNENEESSQYYWHTTDDRDYYCLSKKEAMEKVFERNILQCKKNISELKEQIKNNEQSIIEYRELIIAL